MPGYPCCCIPTEPDQPCEAGIADFSYVKGGFVTPNYTDTYQNVQFYDQTQTNRQIESWRWSKWIDNSTSQVFSYEQHPLEPLALKTNEIYTRYTIQLDVTTTGGGICTARKTFTLTKTKCVHFPDPSTFPDTLMVTLPPTPLWQGSGSTQEPCESVDCFNAFADAVFALDHQGSSSTGCQWAVTGVPFYKTGWVADVTLEFPSFVFNDNYTNLRVSVHPDTPDDGSGSIAINWQTLSRDIPRNTFPVDITFPTTYIESWGAPSPCLGGSGVYYYACSPWEANVSSV